MCFFALGAFLQAQSLGGALSPTAPTCCGWCCRRLVATRPARTSAARPRHGSMCNALGGGGADTPQPRSAAETALRGALAVYVAELAAAAVGYHADLLPSFLRAEPGEFVLRLACVEYATAVCMSAVVLADALRHAPPAADFQPMAAFPPPAPTPLPC